MRHDSSDGTYETNGANGSVTLVPCVPLVSSEPSPLIHPFEDEDDDEHDYERLRLELRTRGSEEDD
jgi:hypothetical protein